MGITKVTAPQQAARGRGRQRVDLADSSASDAKREAILQTATTLFASQGYDRTTMAQIAQQLGVTKPYVYYYFRNKQEVFELLSWRPAVACFTAMDFEEGDPRSAQEKVRAGLSRLIGATIEHYPAAFFPYREPQVYRPEFKAQLRRLADDFYAKLCVLLEQGRSAGWFHLAQTRIAAQAACSIPGFLHQWWRPDGRLPPEAVQGELTDLACRMLGLD